MRSLVIVAPVTTRIRGIRSEVPLGPDDGLPKACVANLDTITTIARSSLTERLAVLKRDKVQAVDAAIRFALGMDRCLQR